jgi:hypothetical protein
MTANGRCVTEAVGSDNDRVHPTDQRAMTREVNDGIPLSDHSRQEH